jgi:Domain of unknown function (DUF4148)
MNKLSMVLAGGLLSAAVLGAQAGELYNPTQNQDQASGLSRAQVKADTLRAAKAGELRFGDVAVTSVTPTPEFGRTRADVKSQTLAARSTGALEHNDVDLPQVAKGSSLTRQEVKAEAVASRQLVKTAPGHNTIDY